LFAAESTLFFLLKAILGRCNFVLLAEKIILGMREPLSESISGDEVDW